MKRYRSVGGTCFDVANTIFLVLLTIVMLYPLVNVLAISFSSKSAIDAGLVTWRLHGFNVSGYQYMLRDAELVIGTCFARRTWRVLRRTGRIRWMAAFLA